MSPARRAVVLGGGGFLGRPICRALRRDGWDVVSVGRRPNGPPGARTVALDLCGGTAADVAAMLTAERAALVVNAAGAVWNATEEDMVRSNVVLVERLLAAIAGLPWRPRLVQLGSVHEYGETPGRTTIGEDTPARPVAPYGRTKASATATVLAAASAGAIDGVVLRVANVMGADAPAESLLGRVTTALVDLAASGGPGVLELATLDAERDFVDGRDVADAVAAAAVRPVTGRLLNVGRGEAVSVRRLVLDLIALSGVPARLSERAAPGNATRVAGAGRQCVDVTAAGDALGWRPRYTVEESLREIWRAAIAADPGAGAGSRRPDPGVDQAMR